MAFMNCGLAPSAAGLSAAMSITTSGFAVESGMTRKYSPASTGESTTFVSEAVLKSTTPRVSLSVSSPVPYFQPEGSRMDASIKSSSECATGGYNKSQFHEKSARCDVVEEPD